MLAEDAERSNRISMSKIAHDIRPPTVVIVGQFNPAIFTPYWTATHLYGIGEGEEMLVTETTMELPNGVQMTLSYLEGVGINFGQDKVHISLVDFENATIDRAVSVMSKMFTTLPHTPIGAIGVNIHWIDADPPQEVLDLFDTPEGLEADFEISDRSFKVQMAEQDYLLNLSRFLSGSEVVFQFNFHRKVANADAADKLIADGFIRKEFERSKQILTKNFGYDEFSVISFKDSEQAEGGG